MAKIELKAQPPKIKAGGTVTLQVKLPSRIEGAGAALVWDAAGHGEFSPGAGGEMAVIKRDGMELALTLHTGNQQQIHVSWETGGVSTGTYRVSVEVWQVHKSMPVKDLLEHISSKAEQAPSLEFTGKAETVVTVEAAEATVPPDVIVQASDAFPRAQVATRTQLMRSFKPETTDEALWPVILLSTESLSYRNYETFMDRLMCPKDAGQDPPEKANVLGTISRRSLPFPDIEPYRLLKVGTEVFLEMYCGVAWDPKDPHAPSIWDLERTEKAGLIRKSAFLTDVSGRRYKGTNQDDLKALLNGYLVEADGWKFETIPYLELVRRNLGGMGVSDAGDQSAQDDLVKVCYRILREKLTRPCFLELIWSYWHEEGMLVQAMNAITWRFQNRRGQGDRDPLALVEIDPLRPLNNFLWGMIQDEQHRLSLPRRVYEYDHHYGLTMLGRAVPQVRGADSRSRFLEAFHHLLHLCTIFYKEDDDTTVVADGFPILNALREVHLLLTQGAHNQYRDLPWTARQEMLMQQWLLARPEFREFLPRRIMVAYPEAWMHSVETMKTLQGWTATSILHFRELGVFGERILLSARFNNWTEIIKPENAAHWARFWRPEIQGYIHNYRAVTGVDLAERVDATMPALLLKQRLAPQAIGR